ncbi:hypothetical protein ACKGJO_12655 [Gracilimonas sp. Q87]|uniref:hypothetical protein n=1 Tax=Gracilimonas sp. Q87 TaxID=3384766 RepID=UPI0039845F50
MKLYKRLGLPTPKFKRHDYTTDHKGQSFKIRFLEWDFDREEFYYFSMPDTYAGKIYEGDSELKYGCLELLFGGGRRVDS